MLAAGYRLLKSKLSSSHVARGASFALAVRVFGAALAFLTQLFLARTMGAAELGIFVFAWTWLSILAVLTPAGFDTALVRFLAEYTGKSQWGEARGVIRLGRIVTLYASLAVAFVGVSVIALGGDWSEPYKSALIIAFAALPLLASIHLHEGIARGFSWIYQVTAPIFALRPVLFLLALLAVLALGRPLSGTVAVAAMSVACALTLAVQIWRYRRALNPAIAGARPLRNTSYWINSALPMVLVVSFEQSLANTDIVMLGIIDSAQATGVYNIAVRIVGIALFVFFAVSAFAAPKIAELYSQDRGPELVRFCHKVRLAIAAPTLLGLFAIVALGLPLLNVFGPEFTSAYVPMIVLCIAVGVRALAGPVDNLLTMTGRQKDLAWVLGAVAVFNLIANALLIPAFGTIGAACATTGSILVEMIWVSILAGRHTGYWPWTLRAVTA